MGLSNFSTPVEGVLPVLVMNTILSLVLLKNMVSSALSQVAGGVSANSPNLGEDENPQTEGTSGVIGRGRRVSTTRFESLCENRSTSGSGNSENENTSGTWCCSSGVMLVECSVCLCGFEAEEEVSELSCKHFFHKGCLEKWFDNQHTTCPLCRSMH